MISSHIQSSRKSLSKRNAFALLLQNNNVRFESRFKVAVDRFVRHFRIVKIVFSVTNQSTLSSSFQSVDSKVVIELFQQQRQKCIVQLFFEKQNFFARHFNSVFDIENTQKRRIFYTREIKFVVINYALIVTRFRDRLINRYMIAKKLKITITMLKNWVTKQHEIENYKKKYAKLVQSLIKNLQWKVYSSKNSLKFAIKIEKSTNDDSFTTSKLSINDFIRSVSIVTKTIVFNIKIFVSRWIDLWNIVVAMILQ